MNFTFEGDLQKFDSNLWYYHVMVPESISRSFRDHGAKRLICQIDSKLSMHCALMPTGEGTYFININKEVRKKLKWRIGQSKAINLTEDKSEYGIEMSIEFSEMLNSDATGSEFFHQLTAGKQRTLIYLATKPKQSVTRLKKSVIILDYLKSVHGKLDFKELNEAFKDRKDDVF